MRAVACPGCGVKLNVPDGKFGRFTCPKCGKALLIQPPQSAGSAPSSQGGFPTSHPVPSAPYDPLALPPTSPLESSSGFGNLPSLPAAGFGSTPGTYGTGGFPVRRSSAGSTTDLKNFVRRLAIGLAIVSVVMLIVGAFGLVSEPIALGACLLGIATTMTLLFSGRIWLVVMAWQESVGQGLLVLFVPYYWIVYVATRKGRTLRALALLIGSLVPMLVCLVMLAVFLPKYQPGAQFGGSSPSGVSRRDLAKIETQIRESYAKLPDPKVLRTVTFTTFSQVSGPVDPAKAEQVLAELPGYVRGSFRHDEPGRTIEIQYYGAEDMAPRYGLILAAKANIIMGFDATFRDGPSSPSSAPITTNVPTASPSSLTPPAPDVSSTLPSPATTELNQLRTVSFQTLGQGAINNATAEQQLASVPGYVAGSFRFDDQNQLVTLQYRGTEAAATQFGFALQRLSIMVRMKPMFSDES